MLVRNVTIDSYDDIGGCRRSSIDLVGGSWGSSEEPDDDVLHVDVVHGDNGPPPPSFGSSFVVYGYEGDTCIYTRNCEAELCTFASFDLKHCAIFVDNYGYTLTHDCGMIAATAQIWDKVYCDMLCYQAAKDGKFPYDLASK